MSVRRKDIVLNVRQWIERAEEDLRLANHAMTMKTSVPYRLVAYHAQQCAEKCRDRTRSASSQDGIRRPEEKELSLTSADAVPDLPLASMKQHPFGSSVPSPRPQGTCVSCGSIIWAKHGVEFRLRFQAVTNSWT
jgi:hypothetical protein